MEQPEDTSAPVVEHGRTAEDALDLLELMKSGDYRAILEYRMRRMVEHQEARNPNFWAVGLNRWQRFCLRLGLRIIPSQVRARLSAR